MAQLPITLNQEEILQSPPADQNEAFKELHTDLIFFSFLKGLDD